MASWESIKIPLHKAIVFDLSTTSADGFLEQHPACILFVRQQFIESLSIPFGLTCGRGDALFLQPSGNLAETVTVEVAVKDPADDGSLLRVNHQLTIHSNAITIAFALGHLRSAVLKTSAQASPDRLTFFNNVHENLPFRKIKTTVVEITVVC